jgi:predicted nucleic-acid-binding protein
VIGLDTNVLIRYLTRDDEQQWQQAVAIVQSGEQCLITNIVICEVVWVLQGKFYKFSKEEIVKTVEMMMQSPVFEFEDRSAVYQALQRTKQGRADFSDYLIGTRSRQIGCRETVTFDRKLQGEKGFTVLN